MNKDAKSRLVDYLKKIYHSSPLIVIQTYSLLYSVWRKVRSFWLPVHLYTGIEHEGSNFLNFHYLGWNHQISSYWLGRIFDQYEQIPCKKSIPFWKINKYLKDKTIKCDLAMVELTNKVVKQRACDSTGFILPRWLKMYMDVDLSLSIIKKRGDIHRKIRKYSLKVEKGSSAQDFAFFYEKMHKPYIECRHKESAIIEDYKLMFQCFKKANSTLYFVIKDGMRVAGMYEQNPDGIPFMYGLGVLDGSEDILKMGVIGALYYFALNDHMKNSIKRVNIGGTSPLLKDGLTMFKLSLGAKVSEYQYQDSGRLKLLPLGNSSVVMDFLTSNSFTYIENEYVYCAVFKDNTAEESEVEKQELYDKTNALRVKKTRVFCFDTNNRLSECIPVK